MKKIRETTPETAPKTAPELTQKSPKNPMIVRQTPACLTQWDPMVSFTGQDTITAS